MNFDAMLNKAIKYHLESGVDYEICPFHNDLLYKDALNFKRDYVIGDYIVDFYFENFNIIIEYNKQIDTEREQHIHKIINETLGNKTWKYDGSLATIINVETGKELKGIAEILSHLQSIFTY